MKKITLVLFLVSISISIYAQDISGRWNGILEIQGTKLKIVFNIIKTDTGYVSTMDSPDQGATGIPLTKTSYENSILILESVNLGIKYQGNLNDSVEFEGKFEQAGLSIPLKLSRSSGEKAEIIRPQEPKKPYPYYFEEVIFRNEKDKIELAGTLTLPQKSGKFPAVILISGSGPQNRDEELLNHKPFLVLSDYLTKKGIAVLRFDDRGVGKSTGNFSSATTFDFATDVEYAVKYLQTRKEIDKRKIGLIGHSEGGLIAPIVVSKNRDIDFIVLMAGSMLRGDKQLLLQNYKISLALGVPQTKIEEEQNILKEAYKIILETNDKDVKNDLYNFLKSKYPQKTAKGLTETLTTLWMINFIRLDPKNYVTKINCHTFAINGKKDLQVLAKENLEVLKINFKDKNRLTIKEFDNLNHLFQECNTGLPIEYGTITQTISPTVLEEISNWILKQVN